MRLCPAILICISCMPVFGAAAAGDEALETARAQQAMFREAAAVVTPSVVRIETIGGAQPRAGGADPITDMRIEDGTPPPEETPFRDTLGSNFLVADGPTTGIILEPDGWILTSSFNFVREPSYITVHLADGTHHVARLVARDTVRKLALLKIEADDLPVPQWVSRAQIEVGQWTIALGRGFGGDSPAITVGVVSALHRMMDNAIQTDAKLSPATYGGPLVDLDGRVLGICVPMAQRPGELAGVEFYDAGIGFAVPYERVSEIVRELKQGKSFYRGWLGIQIKSRSRDECRIWKVADPSPVRALGIRSGDVITQANGREVRRFDGLVQAIYMVPAGHVVQLVVKRDGLERGYEVVLARSRELGAPVEDQKPYDPQNPFEVPENKRRPW
ncbi:MAG: trypsin-like peptidase domain-containing protein [Phycisphaerae bacterium]